MVLNVSFSVDHTQILLSYNQSLVIIPKPFKEEKNVFCKMETFELPPNW